MDSIKVQLFAPGLNAGGVSARVYFSGSALGVEVAGEARKLVPAEHLVIQHGGFDGRQWRLEWPVEDGLASVLLPAGEAGLQFLAAAPDAMQAQLDRLARRDRARGNRFKFGVGVVGMVVLLPFLLLGLFYANAERLAGWAAGHVSIEQEQMLGDLAFAQMRAGLKLVDAGPAPKLVQEVGARLTKGTQYRYQWFVADSPEVNAFAMPGGYVVVYTGLIKAAGSAEEVAGVLAHEVQHVELRHSLKNMIHGLGWQAVLALALGDLSGGIWAGMAEQLGGMAFSRDLEREADLEGLQALRRAGIAPHGMVSFFARLAEHEGPGLALLSSHPASEERMTRLKQVVAEQGDYPAEPLSYAWPILAGAAKPSTNPNGG